jgi:hypothetical protein
MSRLVLVIQMICLTTFVSKGFATSAEGLCGSENKKLDRFCEAMDKGTFFDDEMINVCLWGGQNQNNITNVHNVDGHLCIEQHKDLVFKKDTFAKCSQSATLEQRTACLLGKGKPIASLSDLEIAELGMSKMKSSGTPSAVIRLLQKRAENSGKTATQCEAQITAFKESMNHLNSSVSDGNAKMTRQNLEVLEKAIRAPNATKGN